MIPALSNRGFGHGSGLISPDHTRFIINIPKNASSYIMDWGSHHGWSAALAEHFEKTVIEMIVILRDPVDRWVSGISQYVTSYILSVYGPNGPVFPGEPVTKYDYHISADQFIDQYTDLCERLFFDVVSRFDDHVWPQSEIVDGILPTVPKTFFYLGPDLNKQLSMHLGFDQLDGLDRNSGTDNAEQKKIQDFFKNRLIQRPELRQRLIKHYRQDYDLIAKVFDGI